jgi:glycosyltransferase involved in cell wall biosynthesis
MKKSNALTVGIDASNLHKGGGVTHLVELLRATEPSSLGIKRIVVWGGRATLDSLDEYSWLDKRNLSVLDKSIFHRALWQRFNLSQMAHNEGCDVLLIPGGSYAGNFTPVVTMSQNLLPFEIRELLRYGWSFATLKFLILRLIMSNSFRKSNGVIFLTKYACKAVLTVTGELDGQKCIIPHGVNSSFNRLPKSQYPISDYDNDNPYRILYVSTIDHYKHQWNVVEAIADLRNHGLPVVLDLVGPAHKPALIRLNKVIDRLDSENNWVNYKGQIDFKDMNKLYFQSDLGVFASSCENMPNTLLETMASGLPIACSSLGPMPEVLENAGVFFDPEQVGSIVNALNKLIDSPQLRTKLSQSSHEYAQQYSWKRCANETFEFLNCIAKY